MLKSTISLFLFFSISISLFSQTKPYSQTHEPITIRGVVNDDYSTNNVSPHIRNILFLQERADLILPDKSYLIDLDEESKHNTKQNSIVVVTTNNISNSDAIWNSGDTITAKVYPIMGSSTVYYTNLVSLMNLEIQNRDNRLAKFWKNPTPNDTLYSHFFNSTDLRWTHLMIEQLSNDIEVVVESQIHRSTTQGCEYSMLYDKTKLSDFVRHKLKDLEELPFKAPDQDATKLKWQQWYKWLPEVEIVEPEYNLDFWKNGYNKYSTVQIDGERFLQADDDSQAIYFVTDSNTFVINTIDNSIDTIAGFDPSLKEKKWKSLEQDREKDADTWIEENEKLFDDSDYLKLQNGNTLIVTIENSHFQQFVKVYRMEADGPIKKSKTIMATIPLQENVGNNFSIEKIFEANGKYYVIITTEDECFWNVFDEKLFMVQRARFIQDQDKSKDKHKQEKKPKYRF